MRKKTSTIIAWMLAASMTVTSLSAGAVTAYAQEEMPSVESGTMTESEEAFGDSSENSADIAGEGNFEAAADQEENASDSEDTASQENTSDTENTDEDAAADTADVSDVDLTEPDTPDAEQPTDTEQPTEDEAGDGEEISADTDATDDFSSGSAEESDLDLESNELALDEGSAAVAKAAPNDAEYWCGHYYKVYDSVKTPSAAAEFCKSQGGYLATATSRGENDAIQGLLRNKSSRLTGYLLGGYENKSASTDWHYQYSWSNGEKNLLSIGDAGARFWCGDTTLPLTMGVGDHLAMSGRLDYKYSFGWIWYDSSKSDQSYGFICEWGDPLDVAKGEVTLSRDRFVVNGQPQKPDVTVTYEGQKLEENYDYTYEFSNNISIGKARCTIKGIGRFNGQQTVTFDIVPSAIKELRGNNFLATDTRTAYTNADRKMEVAWDRSSDNNIDGYDIWYSKSEKFESYTEHSVDKSKTEFTSGTLERGTTYYVKVRAYKQVPEGKIEGEWSNVLKVKSGKQVLVNEMWGFENPTVKITPSYVYRTFSYIPAYADLLYKSLGGSRNINAPAFVESKGICFGMVMAALAAKEYGTPSDNYGIDSLNNIKSMAQAGKFKSSELNMTAQDALIASQLMNYTYSKLQDEQWNKNNVFGLYQAVKDCQKGNCAPVAIGLKMGDKSHELLATGIKEETADQVKIGIYDPNYPDNHEAELLLIKNNGSYDGWSYEDYNGTISTASEDRWISYSIEIAKIVAEKLTLVDTGEDDYYDLQNRLVMNIQASAGTRVFDLNKAKIFGSYFSDIMKGRVYNFKASESDDSGELSELYIINKRALSLKEVPAGITISVGSSNHAVTITANQKSDITINVADTNANKVCVTSSAPGSFTATFKDYTDISEPVKETTVKATCKANTTVTVNQTTDQKIQLNGADSASYTRDEGTRNTDTGLLDNAKREEMKDTALDAKKSYQIERKDSDMVLSTSSKNNNDYDEVVQKTPADHKHTWDSGKVTKAATCKETGVKTYTCSGCGQTKTEAIAKTTAHKWSAWKTVTAAKVGVKGSKQRTCSVCGKTETAVIPALSNVSKIKITGFSTKYISGNVRATIKWNAVSKAKKYRICYGYVNNKTYSRKEKSATVARSITVTKKVSFSASNRFWVEAYDSNGKLCGKSDEKYYTDTTIGYYDILPYTGKAQVPYVEVRVQDQFLKKGRDFTVTATNSTYPGKGEVQIRLKGNFRGEIRKPLTIRLRGTSISSLTAGKKYFTLKWKKGSTGVNGYQIQYSTAANFKNAKTVTVKSVGTLTRKVSGLKSGRYYVRIRTYGKIKGKTCYSSWSGAKKATVK